MPVNGFKGKNKQKAGGAPPSVPKDVQKGSSPNPQCSDEPTASHHKRLTIVGPITSPEEAAARTCSGSSEQSQRNRAGKKGTAVLVFAGKSKAGCSAPDVEKTNQDAYAAIEGFADNSSTFWFSVMDGHGVHGHEVSDMVRRTLPRYVQHSAEYGRNPKQALRDAFLKTNCDLFQPGIDTLMSGTTCVACLIQGNTLYTANVGDSRAIMARCNSKGAWTPVPLTDDHKPDKPQEAARIAAADGVVAAMKGQNGEDLGPPRVWRKDCDAPGLAMSRSLGDSLGSTVGVIAEPDIHTTSFTPQDRVLVLASDGIWEFMSNEEVVEVVAQYWEAKNPHAACEALIEEANRRWKAEEDMIDDTTVVLVFLNGGSAEKQRGHRYTSNTKEHHQHHQHKTNLEVPYVCYNRTKIVHIPKSVHEEIFGFATMSVSHSAED